MTRPSILSSFKPFAYNKVRTMTNMFNILIVINDTGIFMNLFPSLFSILIIVLIIYKIISYTFLTIYYQRK